MMWLPAAQIGKEGNEPFQLVVCLATNDAPRLLFVRLLLAVAVALIFGLAWLVAAFSAVYTEFPSGSSKQKRKTQVLL